MPTRVIFGGGEQVSGGGGLMSHIQKVYQPTRHTGVDLQSASASSRDCT